MFTVWGWYKRSVVKWWCWLLLCVDASKIYTYVQYVNFSILHTKTGQKQIQCHDKNIWKNMCVKKNLIVLRPIFNTTYKGKNQVEKYMWLYFTNWSYSYKVGSPPRSVPDNDIIGDILGWTLLLTKMTPKWPYIHNNGHKLLHRYP